MSLNVAFNKKVAPYDQLGSDHVAVGNAVVRLDQIAKESKLATLSEFLSIDPEEAADMFDLDPGEVCVPPLQWFDPENGLAAVRGLIRLLRENPKAVSEILQDLEKIEQELLAASKQEAKFHFALLD